MLLLMQSPPVIGSGGTPLVERSLVRYEPLWDDEEVLLLWWFLNEID